MDFPRYTLIGRATDNEGEAHAEVKMVGARGVAGNANEEDVALLAAGLRQQFEQWFGEPPAHVAVSSLPYVRELDGPIESDNPLDWEEKG